METMITGRQIKKYLLLFASTCVLVLISRFATAQQHVEICTVKNGPVYIKLSRSAGESAFDHFISRFNLAELSLKELTKKNNTESIKKPGWRIDKNNAKLIAISNPLLSSDKIKKPCEHIMPAADHLSNLINGIIVGVNRFNKHADFYVKDSVVRFFLRNNTNAKHVTLAGSFNEWSTDANPMLKTDSGWITNVRLAPGKYWYKFIVDGSTKVDEDNQQKENDGKGNTYSVYYKTNTVFRLSGYAGAKSVYLTGSFNNWASKELLMQRSANGWELALYLPEGTYRYRFIADGNWFADPDNPDKITGESNEYNSVIKIGKPYLFRLNGFLQARQVMLFGSFNNWKHNELSMKKTGYGWELPYVLGLGNHEYRFTIDGTEIPDPSNPLLTGNDRKNGNSVLILGANCSFRLEGFETAGTVILAGDFNGFNETAYTMQKKADHWEYPVYLSPGKHLYKFIVDGKRLIDPGNKLWEQDEYGTENSVIWIEGNQ